MALESWKKKCLGIIWRLNPKKPFEHLSAENLISKIFLCHRYEILFKRSMKSENQPILEKGNAVQDLQTKWKRYSC